MAAQFPPWSNTAIRLALLALVVAVASLVVAPMIYVRTPYVTDQDFPVDQPVEFDHRHHLRDDGIDCRYCHQTVERSAFAGLPATAVCMGCHGQIYNQSPLLEPVRRSHASGLPIPWNRVHDLPDFVYFNHAIHVTKGVGCVTCHGRVDEMPRVMQVAPLTMGWCLDCHRAPESRLRSPAQVTEMEPVRVGRPAAAGGVRHLTNCTTCHR